MKLKTFVYIILTVAIGVLIWNLTELDFNNPDKKILVSIVGNILIIISLILSIRSIQKKEKST